MVRVVKKPEERKSEIIATACQLFLSKGYDRTTMQDVMRDLGIAKGTIYHYFSSKEDLLEAVMDSIAEGEMLRLKKLVENIKGNTLERLEQLIMNGSNHDADEGPDEMLDHLHKTSNAGMHIRLLAKVVTMQAPLYAEQFNLGCKEGIFTTDHPLECAEFLLSGIQFLTDMGIYPWSQEQLERRWKAFPKIIENQLNAPDGSFSFLLNVNSESQ